jgi:hypothetical protein
MPEPLNNIIAAVQAQLPLAVIPSMMFLLASSAWLLFLLFD